MNISKNFVQIYFLEVPSKQAKEFIQHWDNLADELKKNPGLICINLHKEVGKTPTWFIYTLWKSRKNCERAVSEKTFSDFIRQWGSKGTFSMYNLIRKTNKEKPYVLSLIQKIASIRLSSKAILVIAWVAAIIVTGIILALR